MWGIPHSLRLPCCWNHFYFFLNYLPSYTWRWPHCFSGSKWRTILLVHSTKIYWEADLWEPSLTLELWGSWINKQLVSVGWSKYAKCAKAHGSTIKWCLSLKNWDSTKTPPAVSTPPNQNALIPGSTSDARLPRAAAQVTGFRQSPGRSTCT